MNIEKIVQDQRINNPTLKVEISRELKRVDCFNESRKYANMDALKDILSALSKGQEDFELNACARIYDLMGDKKRSFAGLLKLARADHQGYSYNRALEYGLKHGELIEELLSLVASDLTPDFRYFGYLPAADLAFEKGLPKKANEFIEKELARRINIKDFRGAIRLIKERRESKGIKSIALKAIEYHYSRGEFYDAASFAEDIEEIVRAKSYYALAAQRNVTIAKRIKRKARLELDYARILSNYVGLWHFGTMPRSKRLIATRMALDKLDASSDFLNNAAICYEKAGKSKYADTCRAVISKNKRISQVETKLCLESLGVDWIY